MRVSVSVMVGVRFRVRLRLRVRTQEALGTEPLAVQCSTLRAQSRAHGRVPVRLRLWVQRLFSSLA